MSSGTTTYRVSTVPVRAATRASAAVSIRRASRRCRALIPMILSRRAMAQRSATACRVTALSTTSVQTIAMAPIVTSDPMSPPSASPKA